MKKTILLLSALAFIFIGATKKKNDSFCKGWESGYKAGWCYEREMGCADPVIPACPVPRVGEDGYKGGYNRGFATARRHRR